MTGRNIVSRRQFLKSSACTALGAIRFPYVVASSALGKAGNVAASNRITVGWIGAGPQGNYVIGNFLSQKDAYVVAVCDVEAQRRQAGQQRIDQHYQSQGCAAYNDFRELLARDDIDAVLVATPDHWHVPIALAAARAGKDIYLEKPMGLSLVADQTLREVVHRYGIVFQFGTQQRSDAKFRFACELVRNGRIGKLHTINVWCPGSASGGPLKPAPVPEGFDYDMWIGPAPFAPYARHRCFGPMAKKSWWFNSNYCLGWIAGWGIHPLDIAQWGGDTEHTGPVEVEGRGTFPASGDFDTAVSWDIVLNYANGVTMNFVGCPFVGNDVGPGPVKWQKRYKRYGRDSYHGTAFEGTEGWVLVNRQDPGISAQPSSLLESVIGPNEVHLYKSVDHTRNFLDCVKSRAQTVCTIDVAVRSDTICHLSNISIRLERKLKWDPKRELFVADSEANRLLTRAMRSPWHL